MVMINPVAKPGRSLNITDTSDMSDGNTMAKKSPDMLITTI